MKQFAKAAILALALAPSYVVAQDSDAGLAAYEAGDYATALRELKPLAEQGFAKAQNNLGWMYAAGQGVPQDFAEALRWLLLASEQGHASAQNGLGVMYHYGQGVPQDFGLAYMWFSLAAEQGIGVAAANRDRVAGPMPLADIAEAQRRAVACQASGYKDCD